MDELVRLRTRIDKIDREILLRLKARSETAQLIGQVKESRGLPIRVRRREEEVLSKIGTEAERLKLDPSRTRTVFQNIVKLGIDAQLELGQRNSRAFDGGYKCLIVGGTGEMGRLFAGIMKSEGAQVRIVGRRRRSTLRTARELGVSPGRPEDAAESDAVIISVPIRTTVAVATEAGGLMHDGSILLDTSSVKTGVADRIASSTPSRIEYVSLHPLFGPGALTLHGQSVLAIPYRTGMAWRRFRRKLRSVGLSLVETTANQHDQTMGYVQVAHHFALLSLGSSLVRWDGRYKTNSLAYTLERIRALSENIPTIGAIQELNPYAEKARREFLAAGRRLSKTRNIEGALREMPRYVQKWSRKR